VIPDDSVCPSPADAPRVEAEVGKAADQQTVPEVAATELTRKDTTQLEAYKLNTSHPGHLYNNYLV